MTFALKIMFRRIRNSGVFGALCQVVIAASPLREAPHLAAIPADQLVVAGNACGPTALLNAFRFGNEDWQRAANSIVGETDKQRIYSIIRENGMRPSHSILGRPRWSQNGVNLTDLQDIANEMTRGQFLPWVSHQVLFLKPRETLEKLLRRAHQNLETSLAKGLPPVVSLRRYVLRRELGKPAGWVVLDAHFITLISIPRKLEKEACSFPVSYIDPWGGKICHGVFAIPEQAVLASSASGSPCLEAVLPLAGVGKKGVRTGEITALSVAAVLGRW